MPRELPLLRTPRLTLRLATRQDAPAVTAYFVENRAHLAASGPRTTEAMLTQAFWEAASEAALADFHADRGARFYLFHEQAGEVVGSVGLSQLFRGPAQYCMMGYGLAERLQGQGLMSEAVGAVIAYAFGEMNLHRIQANYVPHNVRSGKLLRRLGFTVEGFARDYLLLDGVWQDHILTSLTNPNWRGE